MFKKLLIVVVLAIAGVAGAAYYYWRQATFLPNWYQKSTEINNLQELPTATSLPQEIETKIQENTPFTSINKSGSINNFKGEIQLNSEELDRLIAYNLAQDRKLKQVLQSTKAIHSDIKDSQLEIGAIVNTSKLLQMDLPESKRSIIEQLIEKVPQLKERDIYIAVKGTPQIKDGKIVLEKDSQIKVGNLSFTVTEIAEKLNLPADELQQKLTLDIQQFNLQDIELNQGEIKLKFRQ